MSGSSKTHTACALHLGGFESPVRSFLPLPRALSVLAPISASQMPRIAQAVSSYFQVCRVARAAAAAVLVVVVPQIADLGQAGPGRRS